MNVVIEGKYRIRTFDLSNLVLEVYREYTDKKTKEKKMKWNFDGYFGKLEHAVNHLLQAKLKDDTIESLNEIKECFQHAVSDITREVYNNMTEDELN